MSDSTIVWSPLARDTYLQILAFITKEWTTKEAIKFDDLVTAYLNALIENKFLCPASVKKHLRRCVLTKQTSLVYRVKGDLIELVAFFGNPTDHAY